MYRNARVGQAARHPRRYKSVVTATIVGATVLTLFGPSVEPAEADIVGWDAVADCESGGNWHANTGNGFYGGLQFKESTWREFGGVGSPAEASREEQIAVADRVLDDQGPWAWPTCGPGRVYPTNLTAWLPHPLRGLVKGALPAGPG